MHDLKKHAIINMDCVLLQMVYICYICVQKTVT